MTQSEINIRNLPNGERLFEPDPEARPQGLHNRRCQCPWCQEEKEENMEKTCENCKYKNIPETDQPCNKCINGFCGIVFDPTNWEEEQ